MRKKRESLPSNYLQNGNSCVKLGTNKIQKSEVYRRGRMLRPLPCTPPGRPPDSLGDMPPEAGRGKLGKTNWLAPPPGGAVSGGPAAAALYAPGAGCRPERRRGLLPQAEPQRHLHPDRRRHDAAPPGLSGRPGRLGGRDRKQRPPRRMVQRAVPKLYFQGHEGPLPPRTEGANA